jgi:hypothetical protein
MEKRTVRESIAGAAVFEDSAGVTRVGVADAIR